MEFKVAAPTKIDTEKPVNIRIVFPTNVYFLSGIRDFTLKIVKNLTGFSEQWAFRFQSVVDELCNNAIEHGSAPGDDIKVKFTAVNNERFEVTVEDTGHGQSKMTAEQLNQLFTEKKNQDPSKITTIRGRGLSHIIAPLCDEVIFEDAEEGGIRVKVVKHLKQSQEDSPQESNQQIPNQTIQNPQIPDTQIPNL